MRFIRREIEALSQADFDPVKPAATPQNISTNTQALMYKYKQNNGTEAPLLVWGGNTTMGGTAGALPLHMEVWDYVCYFTVFNDSDLYLDKFTVASYLDAEIRGTSDEPEQKPEFYGANMKLGNNLSMNFYIEAAAVAEAAYAEVTFKCETTVIEKEAWVVSGIYGKVTV